MTNHSKWQIFQFFECRIEFDDSVACDNNYTVLHLVMLVALAILKTNKNVIEIVIVKIREKKNFLHIFDLIIYKCTFSLYYYIVHDLSMVLGGVLGAPRSAISFVALLYNSSSETVKILALKGLVKKHQYFVFFFNFHMFN